MKIIEERAGYLYVEYDGPTDTNALISLMEEMARVCKAKNIKKILADLRNTTGRPNLFQRYELGVMGAIILRGLQIAVVYKTDENNHFAESVVVNRGLPTIITDDLEKAKTWLAVE